MNFARCHEISCFFFEGFPKVTNVNHLGLGSNFRLFCPKERNHHKMIIFKNGTTKDDLQYKDLCKEEYEVRIAYNNEENFFGIDNITNTMIEYHHWSIMTAGISQLSVEYEILKSFFSKFNIKPTWINCNYTWGWFDETGHWTGAVGQVEIMNKYEIFEVLFY